MRAGLSTIQQTLTPESSAILTQSIGEAARRNHSQTTPLHVAAALLSSPSGLLRQACISSHPTSSHPLQCRALELCFSVALDRLPSSSSSSSSSNNNNNDLSSSSSTTTTNFSNNNNNNSTTTTSSEPPISNALMAALKRAQAHQRRGCPETQQSPLLAVKVELEQLVISILDDPSVSRVMKEASFSSPAVKASIEQSLSPSPSSSSSIYINPRLAAAAAAAAASSKKHEGTVTSSSAAIGLLQECTDARKVVEILKRPRKRNPILVGDSDLSGLMREVVDKCGIKKVVSLEKELESVMSTDKAKIPEKIREMGEEMMEEQVPVVVDLGDLKWMVESGGEVGKEVVVEMGKVLMARTGVWLLGRATCATYLRCQVYFPAMERDWDVQAVPVASPPRPLFSPSRLGNGILSSSVEALAPTKGFPPIKPTTIPPLRRPPEMTTTTTADFVQKQTALCPQCSESYEHELANLIAKECDKASSDSKPETRPALPQWLRMATPKSPEDQLKNKEHELSCKQSMEELAKRWRQTCSRVHSSNTFNSRHFQPKLVNPSLPQGFPSLPMAHSSGWLRAQPASPPCSPVKTDLVLGNPKPQEKLSVQRNGIGGLTSFQDSDSLKKLFKGLLEKVSWQPEAASAVTAAISQSKSGNGKRRAGIIPKADTWLLFIGHDQVGKRKMASALSELVFGVEPVSVRMGRGDSDGQSTTNVSFRGKTPLDRVAEAVRSNPFSVVVLEDVDRADTVVRGTLRRAIERGRLADSYGREVSLGSSIFVMTACWLPDELKCLTNSLVAEERILNSARSGWKFEVSAGGGKRLPDWMTKDDGNQSSKRKKDSSLSLDLNLATGGGDQDDEACEGSWNSSELTVEHESNHEHSRLAIKPLSPSSVSEFIELVDDSVVFKPVDFGPLRRRVSECISSKFVAIMGSGRSIRIDDNVLDGIIGGIWMSGVAVDEWAEKVLVPSIEELRRDSNTTGDGGIVRLLAVDGGRQRPERVGLPRDWPPSAVTMAGI